MKKKVLYCILISLFSFAQFSYGQSYLEPMAVYICNKDQYSLNEIYFTVLVPGDFDHSVTGEKSQKVTRENDQKSHLTPLIIRFPEDCQKQFLPFL